MNEGWIKLHRKILYNPIATRPTWAWLWIVLLLRANHKPDMFMWNGGMIHVKEGQLLTGREKLAEASGLSPSTVERVLEYLEKNHLIEQQTFTKFRLITIVNWGEHQAHPDTKSDNRLHNSSDTKSDTNKKSKNERITPKGVRPPKAASRAIDEVMGYLKAKLGVSRLDGSEQGNRRYAHLMLQKIGGNEHDAAEAIKKIIDAGLSDRFHVKNMTDLRYVYYNAMKIIAAHKIGEVSGPKWKVWL